MNTICCVGFVSLDVVCDELNDCGVLVCSSFFISVCMFLCRKLYSLFAQVDPFG